jgi:hypothetical protein
MTERERALVDHYRRSLEENAQLRETIDNLRIERDAADVLLGSAMDELLERSDRPRGRP